MSGRVTDAWLRYQDDRLRRCAFCGEWSYDQRVCGVCAHPVTATPRRTPRLEFSRDYTDLLAIADAQMRADDTTDRRTA